MKIIISLFISLITITSALADSSIPETPVKFRVNTFKQESETYLSLSYLNFSHWHTYWKNPGDAGLELKYQFFIDGQEIKLEEKEWPAPRKFIEQGNMLAYGYLDGYSLFFKLPQEKLKIWENKSIQIKSKWLVCKHICIPGKAEIQTTVTRQKITGSSHSDFTILESELKARFNQLPQEASFPSNMDLILTKNKSGDGLILYYSYIPTQSASIDTEQASLLTPFPLPPFDFKREELKKDAKGQFYGKHPIAWDGDYLEPSIPFPADGKFQKPYSFKFLFYNPELQKHFVIKKSFDSFKMDHLSSENFFQQIKKDDQRAAPPSSSKKEESTSLFYYLIMAFFGGLILNVMPCVLPVISLKLFGLIQYQDHTRSQIFKHNLFYTIGVLITFILLAVVVIILKTSGETVGWGFQLQSPHFVAIMAIIIFIFALSMFGLFEFKVPAGSKLASLQSKEGPLGHIFEGVLATILSTPCSAPFLGTALTFAFTSGTVGIIGMFVVIGLGLSFPFIITALFPGSIRILPKPGNWMNKLKVFLAFTLILTMLWLIDIFNALVDSSNAVIELLTIITMFFFAIFYLAKYTHKNRLLPFTILLVPLITSAHLLSRPLNGQALTSANNSSSLLRDKQSIGLNWEAWSVEKMNQYKSQGELVFIDFTAKWCFTCKVNEKLVLDTADFKKLIEKKGAKLLLADWTKRDEKIGNWLKSQGLVGVPAYFVLKRDGTLVSLGETITLDEIEKSL